MVVAKVFLCWLKKDTAGLVAVREAIEGAVREAIRREGMRDDAIVRRYLYAQSYTAGLIRRGDGTLESCRSSSKRPGYCIDHGWAEVCHVDDWGRVGHMCGA